MLESPRIAPCAGGTSRRWDHIKQELRVNEEIRAREVRVISADGQQLGVLPVREALRLAQERELDLVEIAPHVVPPVCRIMNYGKYKYEQSKKERETRKRQKIVDVKEIRMTPKIEDHDFDVKTKSAERFLRDGDKVKVTVRFRGREIVHSDLARNMLNDLASRLQEVSTVERPPRVEGRSMIMIMAPKAEVPVRGAPAGDRAPAPSAAGVAAAGGVKAAAPVAPAGPSPAVQVMGAPAVVKSLAQDVAAEG